MPQIANMLEGGGQTPVLPPAELKAIGFAMVAYPTTLHLSCRANDRAALADLQGRTVERNGDSVDFDGFKDITGFDEWAAWKRNTL